MCKCTAAASFANDECVYASNQHVCILIGNVGPSVNMIGLSFKLMATSFTFVYMFLNRRITN